MAHATVLASFNVEEFGTERIERLKGQEIVARIEELHAMTQFSGAPLAAARLSLRGARRRARQHRPALAGLYGSRPGIRSATVDMWTFLWLMVFLKIPIVGLFLIVRWAVRQTPETAPGRTAGSARARGRVHPHHPRARPPRPPAQGPARRPRAAVAAAHARRHRARAATAARLRPPRLAAAGPAAPLAHNRAQSIETADRRSR